MASICYVAAGAGSDHSRSRLGAVVGRTTRVNAAMAGISAHFATNRTGTRASRAAEFAGRSFWLACRKLPDPGRINRERRAKRCGGSSC